MHRTTLLIGMLIATVPSVALGAQVASSIVHIEIPEDSADVGGSQPFVDDVWAVFAPPLPLDIATGVGFLVNPDLSPGIDLGVLHDHEYVALHVPDPTRAVVTYKFAVSVAVGQIEVAQAVNGITQIEGFVGDSVSTLVSFGQIFGPAGDVTGPFQFTGGETYVFDFGNQVAGKVFRFVITKTSLSDGYGIYRAYPRSPEGARIPAAGEDCDGDGSANVESYCIASPNTVGPGALMGVAGNPNLSASQFLLQAAGLPPGQPGVFYFGDFPQDPPIPFGNGWRCNGGNTSRLNPPIFADAQGQAARLLDFSSAPTNAFSIGQECYEAR